MLQSSTAKRLQSLLSTTSIERSKFFQLLSYGDGERVVDLL